MIHSSAVVLGARGLDFLPRKLSARQLLANGRCAEAALAFSGNMRATHALPFFSKYLAYVPCGLAFARVRRSTSRHFKFMIQKLAALVYGL